jgi:hypothetical protein
MRTRKPSGLVTPSGLLRLVSHAAMGVAMGLAFALLLILIDPSGSVLLLRHGGSQGLDAGEHAGAELRDRGDLDWRRLHHDGRTVIHRRPHLAAAHGQAA